MLLLRCLARWFKKIIAVDALRNVKLTGDGSATVLYKNPAEGPAACLESFSGLAHGASCFIQ